MRCSSSVSWKNCERINFYLVSSIMHVIVVFDGLNRVQKLMKLL